MADFIELARIKNLVFGNRENELKALLHANPELASVLIPPYGSTLLSMATVQSRPRLVAAILNAGADANQRDGLDDETALHRAAKVGNVTVGRELLRASAAPDAKRDDGATPLHCAAFYGNVEFLKLILDDNQLRAQIDNDSLEKAMFQALVMRQSAVLQYFRELKIEEDIFGAILTNNKRRISKLIEQDPTLLERKLDIWAEPMYESVTPLHFALIHDNLDAVELLLDLGAEVEARTATGMTAYDIAVSRKRRISLFSSRAANLLLRRGAMNTPLSEVLSGENNVASAGAQLDPVCLGTALHICIALKKWRTLRQLLRLDREVHNDGIFGIAMLKKSGRLFRLLIEANVTYDSETLAETLLGAAFGVVNTARLDMLLSKYPDIGCRANNLSITPLFMGVQMSQGVEFLSKLVEVGQNINSHNTKFGITPLMLGAWLQREDLGEIVDLGADIHCRDFCWSSTAIDWLRFSFFPEEPPARLTRLLRP